MKTWIKRSLFALLGTSVLLGGLAACGHRDHEFGASLSPEKYTQKRDKMVDKVAGRLDLNAEQKKHLQTLGEVQLWNGQFLRLRRLKILMKLQKSSKIRTTISSL